MMKKFIPCFILFLSLFFTTSLSAATGDVAAEFSMVAHSFAIDRSENIIYASLSGSNAVAVIDADKLEVIDIVSVGSAPRGMALSWDNTKLYVATSGSATLDVIDLTTFTLLTPYALSTTPGDVEVDALERIYVASSDSSDRYMLMVDPDTRTYQQYNCRTCYTPQFEMNPDGTTLFSANQGLSPGTVEKLDVSGDGLPTQMWVNGHGDLGSNGQDLWLTPEGSHLYYAVGGGNDVQYGYDIAQIDAVLMGINGAFNTGPYPRVIATSPDAKTAYAVHASGHIDVWDAENFQQIKQYSTVGEATELITDRTGTFLFAAFGDKIRVYGAEGSEDLCVGIDCDDGLSCNGEETCVGGICVDGAPLCEDNEYCDETADVCLECMFDGDCDDGIFCNGGGICEAGSCVSTGEPCADDEYCDEIADVCLECMFDNDCDDGIFCNGGGICEAGSCVLTGEPCADDQYCDETDDICVECLASEDCEDDTLYCTGAPICMDGVCAFAPDHCEGDTPVCDEENTRCVECLEDSACEDSLFCTGPPVCTDGMCGFEAGPCEGDTPTCDESRDQCVECLEDAHCEAFFSCESNECIPFPVGSPVTTVTLEGPGIMDIIFYPNMHDIALIQLTDTTFDSSLTISSKLKNFDVNLENLDVAGSLKSLKGKDVFLIGKLRAAKGIGKMHIAGTESGSSINVPWIGKLSIAGHFDGDMTLSGTDSPPKGLTLGKATVKGWLRNSQWRIIGNAGSIKVGLWGAGSILAVGVDSGFDGIFFTGDDVATGGWLEKLDYKYYETDNGGERFGIITDDFLKPDKKVRLPFDDGDFLIWEE